MPVWPTKYAGEDKAYAVDWTNDLGALTITAFDFAFVEGLDAGASLHSKNRVGAVCHVLVTGGIALESAEIRHTITLSDGQEWEEPCYLQIE